MSETSSKRVEKEETATETSQHNVVVKTTTNPVYGYTAWTDRRRIYCRWIVGIFVLSLLAPIWENAKIRRYEFTSTASVDLAPSPASSSSLPSSHERKVSLGKSYPIGQEYFFWFKTHSICTVIQNITGVETLGKDEPAYIVAKEAPPIVNLTVDCEALRESTGNWIMVIYHMRLAAALGRVDFQFQCSSGMASVETSMLPWFSGYYPAPSNSTWPYDLGWPDPNLVCSEKYTRIPLQHLGSEMQYDLRRIAVAMLGPRNISIHNDYNHANTKTTTLNNNLGGRSLSIQSVPDQFLNQQDIQVDDAAIHFRCGDVFGYTTKTQYGVIQFREYVQRIPKATTRTIGIHTQPFNVSLLRDYDKDAANTCRIVVGVMVDYLQNEYPNATITVRNSQKDTIPLTYARLVMAAQTITSTSTFGVFPTIASFGEGYFHNKVNKFAINISSFLSNVHTIDSPLMASPEIAKKGLDRTIQFLTEKP